MRYMIERQYGPCNRDWLATYGVSDKSTCWVLGTHRAASYGCLSTAKLMLERIEDAAKDWDNRAAFRFVIIEDRNDLPYYFASTEIH